MQESYGLEQLHQSLLKALVKLDEICRNHDIKYSLCGGTLLGAERNQRFIPWDDDADLCMERDEYEKLDKVVTELQDSSYYMEKNVLWVPRFVYKDGETTVFVDIFIWDYISEKSWQRQCKINLLRFVQGMMKSSVDYQRYGTFQKLLLFVSYNFGKMFSKEVKRNIYEKVSKDVFVGKKGYVHCSNDTFQGLKYIFDKDYVGNYIDIALENKVFMANERYKESLINYYGEDYLTPPPVSERKPAHQGLLETLSKRAN